MKASEITSSFFFLSLVRFLILLLGLVLFCLLSDVVLVVFAAILLAVVLRAAADVLETHTPLSCGWSLCAVVLILLGLMVILGVFMAPKLSDQLVLLSEELPLSWRKLKDSIAHTSWGQFFVNSTGGGVAPETKSGDWFGRMAGVFSGVFGVLASALVIFVMGIYLAATPRAYRSGFEKLFHHPFREKISGVLDELKHTLKTWLLARLLAMSFVGVAAFVGLLFLDVPLALILGLIAAVLDFIPNFGPVLAFLPAGILALAENPQKALFVALLYSGIQIVEGNVVTPLLEKRILDLPPAVGFVAQLSAAILFGAPGLILATPLVLVVIVLVKRFYLKEKL